MTSFARRLSRADDSAGSDALGLLLFLPLVAVPMGWVLAYSLAYSLGGMGYLSQGWTLRFWQSAFVNGGLAGSIGLSVAVSAIVALVATTVALAIVIVAPELRYRPAALGLLCLPLATPVAVAAFIVAQLLSRGGFLSRLAWHAGIVDSPAQFPVLVNDSLAVGIVLAHLVSAIPLLALYFSQLWTMVRADRYCLLAESLGATCLQARVRVALPLLIRRGQSLVLFVFLVTLGSFEIPLLLGRQSPRMFSVLAYHASGLYDLRRKPELFVLALVYFALIGSLLVLMLRWRRRDA